VPQNLDFLAGGGEMGALMRGRDWAATPLSDPLTWPQSLRSALFTCLNSRAVSAIYWGPEFRLLYNDAYRPFLDRRHPWALGRPMSEIWPTMWEAALTASARQVYETGEGVVAEHQRLLMERDGGLAEAFWTYSFAPIRGETGRVDGIFLTALNTTERALAERRQAFRLALDERVRHLADPIETIAAASEALGRHFGVGQVAYAEVEAGGEFATITREWNDGTMASNAGRHRLDDYGPALIADLRQGRTVAIGEVRHDPRTSSAEALATFARASISGLLNVPLMKGRRMVAILGVHSATPHAWTAAEIALRANWAANNAGRSPGCADRRSSRPAGVSTSPLPRPSSDHVRQQPRPGRDGRRDEQPRDEKRGPCQHRRAIRHTLPEQPRQDERRGHRAEPVGREGPGHLALAEAEPGPDQHDRVDDHHRTRRRDGDVQRQQAAQPRRGKVDACAARGPAPGGLIRRRRLWRGQHDREHQRRRGEEAERVQPEQPVKADHAEQGGRDRRARQRLEIVGEARERESLRVLPLVGEDVGDGRLEGRRKGG
jgi:hypothetical protein